MKDGWKDLKHVVENSGAVVVNGGYWRGDGEVVAIVMDLQAKRAEVSGTGASFIGGKQDECVPSVFLAANGGTLDLDESKPKDSLTEVAFPDFVGWRVFCADVSRYSLHVCLIKEDSVEAKDK